MATWSVALISRIFAQAQPKMSRNRTENIELVKIRATDQVAIKTQSKGSCKFVKFVGKKNPVDRDYQNN